MEVRVRSMYNPNHEKTSGRFAPTMKQALGQTPGSVTPEERYSLERYQQESYYPINRALGQGMAPVGQEDNINSMDNAFAHVDPLGQEAVVYRSCNLTKHHSDVVVEPGSVIESKAFMSTSTSKSYAEQWGSNDADVMVIHMPKGSKAIDMNGVLGGESSHAKEREMLLPRDSSLRVMSVKPLHTQPYERFGDTTQPGNGKLIEVTVVKQTFHAHAAVQRTPSANPLLPPVPQLVPSGIDGFAESSKPSVGDRMEDVPGEFTFRVATTEEETAFKAGKVLAVAAATTRVDLVERKFFNPVHEKSSGRFGVRAGGPLPAKFSNQREAADWLKSSYGIDGSLVGLEANEGDMAIAHDICGGIKDVADKYPETVDPKNPGHLKWIGTGELGSNAAQTLPGTPFSGNGGSLVKFDVQNMRRVQSGHFGPKVGSGDNQWMAAKDVRGVTTHEMGHVYAASAGGGGKMGRVGAMAGLASEHTGGGVAALVPTASGSSKLVHVFPSAYAHANDGEMFAETFTAATNPKARAWFDSHGQGAKLDVMLSAYNREAGKMGFGVIR